MGQREYKKTVGMRIPMVGRLDDIDREIQRCMSRLETQQRALGSKSVQGEMDAELRALEAEVLGKSGRTMLGMHIEHSAVGSVSYTVHGASPVDITKHVSCQSGGMYGSTPTKDVRFFRDEHEVRGHRLVVYRTRNKDDEFVVCAVAVFHGERFVSYLFSTNDPLAFDNFNCFRGYMDPSRKPGLQCVEQLVFCENKVQLNLKYLTADDEATRLRLQGDLFKVALTGPRVTYGLLLDILKKHGIDYGPELMLISDQVGVGTETFKVKALETMREKVRVLGPDAFYNAYIRFFHDAIGKPSDLSPFQGYKQVGQSLFAVNGFLGAFDACGILCAMSARMRLLSQSPVERALVASLVPGCVVECSKDDNIWAYMVVPTFKKDPAGPVQKKLDWLFERTAAGFYTDRMDRLFHIIEHATASQNKYISQLDALITGDNIEGAVDFLFNPCGDDFKARFMLKPTDPTDDAQKHDFSMHKLGLSERLLQALWTGQIKFPPTLTDAIEERMRKYGLEYFHYVPTLTCSETLPRAFAMQIGVPHTLLPRPVEATEG